MTVNWPNSLNATPVRHGGSHDDTLDLFKVVRVLWGGRWMILASMIVMALLGRIYVSQGVTPTYTARAVVMLESRQEQVVDIDNVISGLGADQATVNTEVEVLRSRGLIGKLVDRQNLTEDAEFNPSLTPASGLSLSALKQVFSPTDDLAPLPDPDVLRNATIDRVLSAITIANLRNSFVFTITAITSSPTKSANLANALADAYIQDQVEVKFAATEKATSWLTERVAVLQSDLERAEAAVKAFSARTDLVSAEALEVLNRQIKDARLRQDDLRVERELQAIQIAQLEAAYAGGDAETLLSVVRDLGLGRLIRGDAEGAQERGYELARDRLFLEQARTQAQASSIATSMAQLQQKYTQQSEDLLALEQLSREAEANRLIYEHFLARLKETSVQAGIQQADSRVLSTAAIPTGPSAPHVSRFTALAGIVGFLLCAGAILTREILQNGFRTSEELEAFSGLAVLGKIPSVPSETRRGLLEYLVDKPTSSAAEAVRNLRTSVVLSNLDHPPQVLMISSSGPGEGKTTVSIAMAQNYVGMGKRVLLIEGDLRRQVFSHYFDLAGTGSLQDVLSGEQTLGEAVQQVDRFGADILVAGRSAGNAADVFSSDRFRAVIQEARVAYDIVIIDTPPVLAVPDARVIAHVADAVLYVVRWNATARHQISEGLKQFAQGKVLIAGLVLTQIDMKKMKQYGYGDAYGGYAAADGGYYES